MGIRRSWFSSNTSPMSSMRTYSAWAIAWSPFVVTPPQIGSPSAVGSFAANASADIPNLMTHCYAELRTPPMLPSTGFRFNAGNVGHVVGIVRAARRTTEAGRVSGSGQTCKAFPTPRPPPPRRYPQGVPPGQVC
jgi:hypothetical protein